MSPAAWAGYGPTPAEYDLRARQFDAPDARHLLNGLYLEQTRTYGFADAPTDPPDDYAAPSGLFLVAYTPTDEPVACGGCRNVPGNQKTMEIRRMYVTPAHRGRNLGRHLLTDLENHARTAGATTIILETGANNHAALGLYKASGYSPIPSYVPNRTALNRAFSKPL